MKWEKLIIKFFLVLCLGLCSCTGTMEKANSQIVTKKDHTIGIVDATFLFQGKVQSMLEDSKGNFWIGSRENGLCKFDGHTYTYFTTQDGLSSNSIRYIQEDANGNIWIDDRNNISKFDGKQFIHFDKKFIPVIRIQENPIQLTKHDLWFTDHTKFGVYRYDGQNVAFISFEDASLNLNQDHSRFFISSVTDMDVTNNQVWFGTLMQGAIGLNGKAFTKISDELFDFESSQEFLHIRSMLLDSKGNLWIGNNGIGVIVKKGHSLIHFSKKHDKLIPLDEFEANTHKRQFLKNTGLQAVFAIEEDNEGNIWFGDRDSGVWKYDGKNLQNYKDIYHKESLDELVWDIYNDRKGNLYFILVDGSVFTFNGNSFDKFQGF